MIDVLRLAAVVLGGEKHCSRPRSAALSHKSDDFLLVGLAVAVAPRARALPTPVAGYSPISRSGPRGSRPCSIGEALASAPLSAMTTLLSLQQTMFPGKDNEVIEAKLATFCEGLARGFSVGVFPALAVVATVHFQAWASRFECKEGD